MSAPATEHLRLYTLPEGTRLRSVTAAPGTVDGRAGTRIALTDEIAQHGTPGVDYIDQPTMALLPLEFTTGTVSVDIHSQLTPEAPDYARGFAGIAFHATPTLDHFESVYLRPTNGTLTNPGPPRDQRGIQYFAYPDWPFDRLREEHPAGTYEAAAPITPGRWFRLSVNVAPDRITTSINDTEVLHIQTPLAPPRTRSDRPLRRHRHRRPLRKPHRHAHQPRADLTPNEASGAATRGAPHTGAPQQDSY